MAMKDKEQKEYNKLLEKLPLINEELHKQLSQTILRLLRTALKEEGITEQEIEAAKEVAELKPESKAAKELLKLLGSREVK